LKSKSRIAKTVRTGSGSNRFHQKKNGRYRFPESAFSKTRLNTVRTLGTRIWILTNASSKPDVKASATVVAAAVYNLAMREELLPRFTRDQMPRLPNN
jgi:hypothetical protein